MQGKLEKMIVMFRQSTQQIQKLLLFLSSPVCQVEYHAVGRPKNMS